MLDTQPRSIPVILTALDKVQVYQTANRIWRKLLTPSEMSAVYYFIDRSIGWGKDCFKAGVRNILEGSKGYSGIGLSRATFFRVLSSLEKKGIITKIGHKTHITVHVNTDWTGENDMLKIPKRLQNAKTGGLTVRLPRSHCETQSNISDQNKSKLTVSVKTRKRVPVKSGEVVPVQKTFAELSSEVSADYARRKTTRAARAKSAGYISTVAVERLWVDALPNSALTHRAWTRKDQARMKREIKAFVSKTSSFGEYVQYSVENWAAITRKHMGWMKKSPPPIAPDIGFFLSFQKHFMQAFADQSVHDFALASDTSRLDKLLARGMGRDDAIRHIAKEDATADMRDTVTKERAHAARDLRKAQQSLQRAEKLDGISDRLTEAGVSVSAGTERRAGQAWGHNPTLKTNLQLVANAKITINTEHTDDDKARALENMRAQAEMAKRATAGQNE